MNKQDLSKQKERSIIFNGEMVCAILENRKTQTRRILKPQPWDNTKKITTTNGIEWNESGVDGVMLNTHIWKCPYGQVGDRLWVRETFLVMGEEFDERLREVFYRADTEIDSDLHHFSWRPSVHMPRWASRITLEITDIRVERLQDISEEDAKKEGFDDKFLFTVVWDITHRKDENNWFKNNPWVWVIEFRRLDNEQN